MEMIWSPTLRSLLPNNPLILYLLHHQQRRMSFLKRVSDSLGSVTLALSVVVMMLFFVVSSLAPQQSRAYIGYVQLFAWTFQAMVVLRFIAAGTTVVARDSILGDSNVFRLTSLSNARIFIGWWWAAMYRLRGWMLALGIVQLGIVTSLAFGQMMTPQETLWFTPARAFAILAAVVVLTLLETACSYGLGVAAAMTLGNWAGFVVAALLRFAPVLLFAVFPFQPGNFQTYYEHTIFRLADGGTGALVQLLAPVLEYQHSLLGLGVTVGILAVYISLALMTAGWVMQRARPE